MVQAQVLDLLTALVRDRGLGLVIISHDLSVLATTCDRVAVMYAGRVVEQGRSADVLVRARHPYTRALSAAFPTIGDPAARFAPRGLPGDPPCPATSRAAARSTPLSRDRSRSAGPSTYGCGPPGPEQQAACVHVGPEVAP